MNKLQFYIKYTAEILFLDRTACAVAKKLFYWLVVHLDVGTVFYFNNDVGAFNVIIFIGSSGVDTLSVVSDAIRALT